MNAEPSPTIDAPPCPHVDRCGGCTRLGEPMAAQLVAKRERVARVLAAYPELGRTAAPEVLEARPAFGYRPRAKWVVGPQGEIGLFAREGDHVVVDTPDCRVVEPAVAETGALVRRALLGAHRGLLGHLRAVDVRATANGDTLVTLGLSSAGAREPALVLGRALEKQGVRGVAIAVAPAGTGRVVAGRPEPIAGVTELVDAAGTVRVRAAFGGFVQSHRAQPAELARRVVELTRSLGPAPRVLELFAGSGALGLAVARSGARVTMVESFDPAARGILRAAEAEGLACEAHADDAARFIERAAEEGSRFDAVLVDPPRRGLPPALREAIARLDPRVVIYVACEPATWARDAAHLGRLGWSLRELTALDLMPHTDEVELVSSLERAAQPVATPMPLAAGAACVDVHPHDPTDRTAHPRGASGLFLVGASSSEPEWTAWALVQGVTHARGRLTREITYRRTEVAGGHGVLELSGKGPLGAAVAALSRIGHPILGDARAGRATNDHFFERHGLDRLALHVTRLGIGDASRTSALAGDLATVLASLHAVPQPKRATAPGRARPRPSRPRGSAR